MQIVCRNAGSHCDVTRTPGRGVRPCAGGRKSIMKSLFYAEQTALGLLGSTLVAALLLTPNVVQAAEEAKDHSGWSLNFTPVLVAPKGNYRWGGGADPELKYTVDREGARLSAGLRLGGYYAKNLFGITAMPTLRITVPVGRVEPYASFGMGYGWIPKEGEEDIATMSRLGIVFRVSKKFALGLEGTLQRIERSEFRFPSLGSAITFDF